MAKIDLDSAGIEAVLNSAPVNGLLMGIAANMKSGASRTATAKGKPIPVTVSARTASGGRLKGTRPAYDVTLAHPAGMAVEAKRGPLARAAAGNGLTVRKKA